MTLQLQINLKKPLQKVMNQTEFKLVKRLIIISLREKIIIQREQEIIRFQVCIIKLFFGDIVIEVFD